MATVYLLAALSFSAVLASALVAVITSRAGFDPAPLPDGYAPHAISVPERRPLRGEAAPERVGEGLLPGPEDLAHDAATGFLYTGCSDGWIRRVRPRDEDGAAAATERVEEWAYVGGRPLGVALGPGNQLIVAESHKGLLAVSEGGGVRLLADTAEGLPFRLTDGVDVASDGAVYFTDASHKYDFPNHMLDILEGRPNGRLLRYDPAANATAVLLRGLYFANGVAVAPDQSSLVFCETTLRRCRRYYIAGEKKGLVEPFIDGLPGFPDNIRYDGDGHFWIGLPTAKSRIWDVVLRFPWLRKMMGMALQLQLGGGVPYLLKGSGVLRTSLEGEPIALYTEPEMELVTGGIKIGRFLYYGSLVQHHIGRVRL